MGLVMTTIKLSNYNDVHAVKRGELSPDAVRSVEIDALADTGAIELCIPEELMEVLDLTVMRHRQVTVADGRKLEVAIVGPLVVEVLGRDTFADAILLPRGTRPLLGALQMEQLDLVVVPRTGEVIGNPEHPDGPVIPLTLAS
jgi:clan AA aspartic protease